MPERQSRVPCPDLEDLVPRLKVPPKLRSEPATIAHQPIDQLQLTTTPTSRRIVKWQRIEKFGLEYAVVDTATWQGSAESKENSLGNHRLEKREPYPRTEMKSRNFVIQNRA